MVIADLDMALITKRKRMMDSVGHYARPELLSLAINERPGATTLDSAATIDFTVGEGTLAQVLAESADEVKSLTAALL